MALSCKYRDLQVDREEHQMLTAGPYNLPFNTSGAQNLGVPQQILKVEFKGVVMPANPKSDTLAWPLLMRIFSGFKSW